MQEAGGEVISGVHVRKSKSIKALKITLIVCFHALLSVEVNLEQSFTIIYLLNSPNNYVFIIIFRVNNASLQVLNGSMCCLCVHICLNFL